MKSILSIILVVFSLILLPILSFSDSWHTSTIDTEGNVGYSTSIVIDPQGFPNISYNGDYNLKYAYKDSSGWHITSLDTQTIVEGNTSIDLGSYNYPHISYYDCYNSDLKYAYKDGSGWHYTTVDSTGLTGAYNSIKIDTNNYPHIAYFYSEPGYDLKYAYKDNNGWHIETVDSNGSVGAYCSIALDSTNHPYISYYDDTNGNLKFAYRGSQGNWRIDTVDSAGLVGKYTSIDLDSDNYPHISYFDETNIRLKYVYHDGSNWNIYVVDDPENGWVGWYTSIKLDSDDNPHVSYYDVDNGDLKFAECYGWVTPIGGGPPTPLWDIDTIDSNGDVGMFTSVDLDSNDNPQISYFDDEYNKDLKYAWYEPDISSYIVSNNKIEEMPKFVIKSIYPNPASDYINLTFSNYYDISEIKIEIYDISGRKLISQYLQLNSEYEQSIKIDTSQLVSGIYIIKTICINNNKLLNKTCINRVIIMR